MTQRHGLASDDDGQGIFHFGFSYLVNHFQQSQERMDIELVALAQKHRSTILLLDRAAQYYEECDAILRRDHHLWEMADGRHISEIAPIMKAMEDGPIFLDVILNYLRTHADVHAGLVRKLYGPHGKDTIKGVTHSQAASLSRHTGVGSLTSARTSTLSTCASWRRPHGGSMPSQAVSFRRKHRPFATF